MRYTKRMLIARANSYDYLTDFITLDPKAYALIRENGWYQEATHSIRSFCHWSEELIYEVAKYYTSIEDFKAGDKEAYDSAYRHGWLDNVRQHLSRE